MEGGEGSVCEGGARLLLWWALLVGWLLLMRPEEKKTLLLAYLVREKKMWRLWLGEGDVRSADG
jgi:hypothetical protein